MQFEWSGEHEKPAKRQEPTLCHYMILFDSQFTITTFYGPGRPPVVATKPTTFNKTFPQINSCSAKLFFSSNELR